MSGFDCGHACCDERNDPHHDHFLDIEQCPGCKAVRRARGPALSPTEEPKGQDRRDGMRNWSEG